VSPYLYLRVQGKKQSSRQKGLTQRLGMPICLDAGREAGLQAERPLACLHDCMQDVKQASKQKDLVQRLESTIIHWTRQIKEVVNRQDSQVSFDRPAHSESFIGTRAGRIGQTEEWQLGYQPCIGCFFFQELLKLNFKEGASL
jgi:hypothetical protein